MFSQTVKVLSLLILGALQVTAMSTYKRCKRTFYPSTEACPLELNIA